MITITPYISKLDYEVKPFYVYYKDSYIPVNIRGINNTLFLGDFYMVMAFCDETLLFLKLQLENDLRKLVEEIEEERQHIEKLENRLKTGEVKPTDLIKKVTYQEYLDLFKTRQTERFQIRKHLMQRLQVIDFYLTKRVHFDRIVSQYITDLFSEEDPVLIPSPALKHLTVRDKKGKDYHYRFTQGLPTPHWSYDDVFADYHNVFNAKSFFPAPALIEHYHIVLLFHLFYEYILGKTVDSALNLVDFFFCVHPKPEPTNKQLTLL